MNAVAMLKACAAHGHEPPRLEMIDAGVTGRGDEACRGTGVDPHEILGTADHGRADHEPIVDAAP